MLLPPPTSTLFPYTTLFRSDPVDDMRDENPPSHPELLDDLAKGLAEHQFDLKFLMRAITRSEEHTSELQSLRHLVCRLLLEKKKYRSSKTICLPSNTNTKNA